MARILVIDDEKNIRKMVELTLIKARHKVKLAENGAQGLALFGDGSAWDATLVDQRMPELEGREFTYAARQRDPAARIVMMTAFATLDLAAEVVQAGATDFLRKPFSTDTLRGAVTAALNRPRRANQPDLPAVARSVTPPLISYFLNGFNFWPLAAAAASARLPGLAIARVFQVCGPHGTTGRCLVGVTPHVQAQVFQTAGQSYNADDTLWEMLCQLALSDYLLDKAALPPAMLPIYELTSNQLYMIRDLSSMKPGVDY